VLLARRADAAGIATMEVDALLIRAARQAAVLTRA
jgi:hypothetical protein